VFLFYDRDRVLSLDGETALIKSGIEVVRADGQWSKTAYDGDEFLLNALCVDGAIFSFISCVFPSAITQIREVWLQGKIQKARDMYFDLSDKIRLIKSGGVPYLKYALSLWGLSYSAVRSPYIECDDDEKALVRRFFD
jgi:dihydrodipicolinate synthase/N-acetylneuraminate lyase